MIKNLDEFSQSVDYSLLRDLTPDPESRADGDDHVSREVKNGHYVPVKPEPIAGPIYVIHSKTLFEELGISDELAQSKDFMEMFSGNLSQAPDPMKNTGWSCGYALSIYGTEYVQNCPFQTGNGYGDGRAISIYEGVLKDQRWEMQLKGGGRSPYCRGADGRAVLRSSVREFLAQEHMHGLGIPTSRSLTLYTSKTQSVQRPWFFPDSCSMDPEVMIEEAVAISTRVASSFLRVGQVELFARRARMEAHPHAQKELHDIVQHLIKREYPTLAGPSTPEQLVQLATAFRDRLCTLVAHWIRVGYCQGNFNSDNCALGGFTLDYGPFGFMDQFNPIYQPWTGGGQHFSFFNQPKAAENNFMMFCNSLKPLLEGAHLEDHPIEDSQGAIQALDRLIQDFPRNIHSKVMKVWAAKLGLETLPPNLLEELIDLMMKSPVDYTIFFRELSNVPESMEPLQKSFYPQAEDLSPRWEAWLQTWLTAIQKEHALDLKDKSQANFVQLSQQMKRVNPKYTLREWFLVPAYERANHGEYSLIQELQQVMTSPYDEQSKDIEEKYYRLKPQQYFNRAGVSHVSCSS